MERWSESRILMVSLCILMSLGSVFLLLKMVPYLEVFVLFLKEIIGPFVIAMIISYLLNPVVNLLHERAVPRSLAVIFIYTTFLCCIVILVINMFPMFERQLSSLVHHLPNWNSQLRDMIHQYTDSGKETLPLGIHRGLEKALTHIELAIGGVVGDIGDMLKSLFVAFIVPFLAFYMMKDAQAIEKFFMTLIPNRRKKETVQLLRNIDMALGNYVRGQLLVCCIVGVFAYIGYLIIGLPYALLFAFVVAVFNVIPYLGPIFGAIPAVLFGITLSTKVVIGIIVVNLIVQMLEGNMISPQVVGRSVRMHPLLIIFALLIGGELGGVLGLILAVPLFVVGKVIIEHVVQHYVHRKV